MARNKEALKTFDSREAKELMFVLSNSLHGAESLLSNLSNNLMPRHGKSKGEEKSRVLRNISDKALEAMMAFGAETHAPLTEAFDVKYRRFVKTFTDQVVDEYECKTYLEKSLAEMIANAYIRNIDNSRRLNNEFNCEQITPNRNQYIALLSKQVDRSHRQFLSGIFALKQLKSPQIEVSIKTQNAFISQNQQINTTDKDHHHEIISPK